MEGKKKKVDKGLGKKTFGDKKKQFGEKRKKISLGNKY